MDKLTVLNRALVNTGNQQLNALNDGTDEWLVADSSFERSIEYLIARHHWPFARVGRALVPVADADNPSLRYEFAYELPDAIVHIRAVLINGVTNTSYEIVGRHICVNTDTGVSVEGFAMPAAAKWHPLAAEILTQMVEVGCLRGLNEDFVEAARREAMVEETLIQVRPRVSRQNPAKNAYTSSIAAARRQRRTNAWRGGTATDAGNQLPPDGSVLLDE